MATVAYEGMIAETISINGNKGEPISAYVARPLELTLEAAKALSGALTKAIVAAEIEESARARRV